MYTMSLQHSLFLSCTFGPNAKQNGRTVSISCGSALKVPFSLTLRCTNVHLILIGRRDDRRSVAGRDSQSE